MRDQNTLSVEWRAIGSICPYPGNPRRITQAAIEKVAASIKEFGWRSPIVVDEAGVILAGHTRHQAAHHLQLKKVPVHVAKGLTPDQAKAYRLADNRSAEEAEWDIPALAIELKALDASGFDLQLTAFTDADLAPIFADPALPPSPTDPRSEWKGMPGYENEDLQSFRRINVHFADQAAVDAFAQLLGQTISPKTPAIWYPEVPRVKHGDKRYTAETP